MSYEIVYNRQFLKIDGKIIPLVLHGSNNCGEITIYGKERRERHWSPLYWGSNTEIAVTEDEIMDRIDSCLGGCQEHFKRNGKWVDDSALLRFYKNGIKEAKTIEELGEIYFFSGLTGYFSIWKGLDNNVEAKTSISNSDELRAFLVDAKNRIERREEKEAVYICLCYRDETFRLRVPKKRTPKERLADYYAIKVNDSGYLWQLTSRRIRYGYLGSRTRQFKSEKEANKYVEKLKDRFSCAFSVEHIVA